MSKHFISTFPLRLGNAIININRRSSLLDALVEMKDEVRLHQGGWGRDVHVRVDERGGNMHLVKREVG